MLRNVLTPQRLEALCSSRPLKTLIFQNGSPSLNYFFLSFLDLNLKCHVFPTSFFNSFYTCLQSYSFNIDFAVLSSIDCLG